MEAHLTRDQASSGLAPFMLHLRTHRYPHERMLFQTLMHCIKPDKYVPSAPPLAHCGSFYSTVEAAVR